MIETTNDDKYLQALLEYKYNYLNMIMRESSDLVYYGKFTMNDVDNLVPVDRREYIYLTNKRIESLSEAIGILSILL